MPQTLAHDADTGRFLALTQPPRRPSLRGAISRALRPLYFEAEATASAIARARALEALPRIGFAQCFTCFGMFALPEDEAPAGGLCPHCGGCDFREGEPGDAFSNDARRLADEIEEVRIALIDAPIGNDGLPILDSRVGRMWWEHLDIHNDDPDAYADAEAYHAVYVRPQVVRQPRRGCARPRAAVPKRPRARRSHRVVAKSTSGDSGDGDPEPPSHRPTATIGGGL